MTIKSVSYDQHEILDWIRNLHCDGKFDADFSYGKGSFYKNSDRPSFCFDIDPQKEHVINASSVDVPLEDESIRSVVFDPPFLTYIKKGRSGNGSMVMANTFSGYWRYDELEEHYKLTLEEANRVLSPKGVMVFKCQDLIHNHKMHCTHANVIQWAGERGFRLLDLFILPAKHRMPVKPNKTTKGKQKHARVYHSYFLVLLKTKNGGKTKTFCI